jgi:hypothetical protein
MLNTELFHVKQFADVGPGGSDTCSTNALSRVARTAGSTTAVIASTASANIAALIGRSTKIIGSPRDSGAFAAREAVLREKRHALVNVVTSY